MISATPLDFKFLDQNFLLLPQKSIFWIEENALIVADVHLGKVGHFRKAGIAIPRSMEQEDLAMLSDLMVQYRPSSIIFLGDLFHSDMNNDWGWFILWRDLHKDVEMILVRGNHDILHEQHYIDSQFRVHDTLKIGPFLFSHEPLKKIALSKTSEYVISGHIHPGVKLRGKGRQSVTLPCFHFGKRQALVPAFGKFTGKACVKCEDGDHVFGVLKHKVIAL
ncbi:ligase-associated DNA damage response endonuclease PdeM [Daejeonella oryzae]|uniref:ligase-associated DNA damage response endonuclease PdeM n=1 Tax=Daejeonella oryzae TaxID=1122943 RepID=UPI0004118622|nr:ligase-associated DNA damage response endonuclease PdeM [Daejeonella oryzae]